MIELNFKCQMQLTFSFYLPATTVYLVDTSGYLVVTSGYLITTTRYFWLLLVTPGYFLLLLVPRFCNNVFYDENHRAKFVVESVKLFQKIVNYYSIKFK